jgi:hypothetical protein
MVQFNLLRSSLELFLEYHQREWVVFIEEQIMFFVGQS